MCQACGLGQVVVIGTVTANTGGAGAIACVASHAITNNIQGLNFYFGGTSLLIVVSGRTFSWSIALATAMIISAAIMGMRAK